MFFNMLTKIIPRSENVTGCYRYTVNSQLFGPLFNNDHCYGGGWPRQSRIIVAQNSLKVLVMGTQVISGMLYIVYL